MERNKSENTIDQMESEQKNAKNQHENIVRSMPLLPEVPVFARICDDG